MKINYYRRVFKAYLVDRRKSNLRFWHTELRVNPREAIGQLKNYYLDYTDKIKYPGPFDKNGVPMLNYFGDVGIQYNPDSIAQYALGYFEKYLEGKKENYKKVFLRQADWFVKNLKERDRGIGVWEYNFDFEYFKTLKKPWYTSLGQGHGISVLVRAYSLTQRLVYLETAERAFRVFHYSIEVDGGVKYVDREGYMWFEEAVINPPTHILNGFIWALWGIYDYWLATKEIEAKKLFYKGVETLEKNLNRYDNGFWSTYDLAPTKFPGIASWYYHNLHIAQLRVMHLLTGKEIFQKYADKWEGYKNKRLNRWLAFVWKSIFKLLYY